jgi:hypothetical protein
MPRRRKTVQRGDGFFDGFKSVYNKVVKPVARFAKKHRLVSKGLALTGNPMLSGVANMAGYGRPVAPKRMKM